MFLTSPGPPDKLRVVAFVYDTEQYGRVVVEEHYPDVPADQYSAYEKQVVESIDDPNVHGTAELVQLDGGETGLLTDTEAGGEATLVWLEDRGGPFEAIVRGPTLTKQQAIDIADAISAQKA
jgi:hypothetical protein